MKLLTFIFANISFLAYSDAISLPSQPFQPDYAAWQRIRKGDSASQVIQLLGKPKIRLPHKITGADSTPSQIWIYGCVTPNTTSTPFMFFRLDFKEGHVSKIVTPFGNAPLSKDGKPSIPQVITPRNGFKTPYPGIVDFRWFPSSGKYPMRYVLQIDTPTYNGKWNTRIFGDRSSPITLPYFMRSGLNEFRWRLKAVNELGESSWTSFLYSSGLCSEKDLLAMKKTMLNQKLSALFDKKEYDLALSELRSTRDENRKYSSYCENYIGVVYFYFKNNPGTALRHFDKAIKLDPDFIFPYTNRGWINLLRGKDKGALKDFQKHLDLSPRSGFAHFKVGVLYYYQKEYETASRFFQKGMKVDPKFFYNFLYGYFANVKRGVPSTRQLLSFLKLNPKTSYSLTIKMYAGRITKNVFLKLSVDEAKNWPTANKERYIADECFHVGMSYLLSGNKEAAKSYLEKTVKGTRGGMSLNRILAEKELQALSVGRGGSAVRTWGP